MRESVERGSNLRVSGWIALSLFTPVDVGFDLDNELVLVEGTTARVLNANARAEKAQARTPRKRKAAKKMAPSVRAKRTASGRKRKTG